MSAEEEPPRKRVPRVRCGTPFMYELSEMLPPGGAQPTDEAWAAGLFAPRERTSSASDEPEAA